MLLDVSMANPWQWALTLQPATAAMGGFVDQVRVLRALSADGLRQALASFDERERVSFAQVVLLEAHRLTDTEGEAARVRLTVGVPRRQLDPLATHLIGQLDRLLALHDERDDREEGADQRLTFPGHACPGSLGRGPLHVDLQGIASANAWAAELALQVLGHPPTPPAEAGMARGGQMER